ncbi:MAG: hypothetical protein D4R68_04670 [Ignavibacteriales bacterium]|nr:MAG: hypothetical protein D4R68_04670 [Ignavibacteriales bacterium]
MKTLAFETRPVNPGNCVTSFDLPSEMNTKSSYQEGNFTKQIEERLRARAGNPSTNPLGNVSRKSVSEKNSALLGSGISEDEIQKIIREFNK